MTDIVEATIETYIQWLNAFDTETGIEGHRYTRADFEGPYGGVAVITNKRVGSLGSRYLMILVTDGGEGGAAVLIARWDFVEWDGRDPVMSWLTQDFDTTWTPIIADRERIGWAS